MILTLPMRSKQTASLKVKPDAISGAQQALRKTLKTLEAERAKMDSQIRVVRSALAVMGIQHPHLVARAKRKPMTEAERRSVSKRMRAYWAKKRSQQPN